MTFQLGGFSSYCGAHFWNIQASFGIVQDLVLRCLLLSAFLPIDPNDLLLPEEESYALSSLCAHFSSSLSQDCFEILRFCIQTGRTSFLLRRTKPRSRIRDMPLYTFQNGADRAQPRNLCAPPYDTRCSRSKGIDAKNGIFSANRLFESNWNFMITFLTVCFSVTRDIFKTNFVRRAMKRSSVTLALMSRDFGAARLSST